MKNYKKFRKKNPRSKKNKAPKTIIEPFDFHEPVKKKIMIIILKMEDLILDKML